MDSISSKLNSIQTEIDDLEIKWYETDDKIARFGVNYPIPDAAESDNNIINGLMLDIKDIIIIGFLLINMLMAIYNCIYKTNKDSKITYLKGVHQKIDYDINCELTEEEVQLK